MTNEIFSIAGIAFSLLGAYILIRKWQFQYLGLVLLCCSLLLLEEYFLQSKTLLNVPYFAEVFAPLVFLIPPLLFFQMRMLLDQKTSNKWLYLILPLTAFLNFAPLYLSSLEYKTCYVLNEIHNGHSNSCLAFIDQQPVLVNEDIMDGLMIFQFIALLLYLLNPRLFRAKKKSTARYWHRLTIRIVISSVLFTLLSVLFLPEEYSFKSIFIFTVATSILFVLVGSSNLLVNLSSSKSYDALPDSEAVVIFDKLLSYIGSEEAYANQELTMQQVASHIGYSTNKVSHIVNLKRGNFRMLVNEIRIEKAAEFLQQRDSQQYSMDGIAQKFGYKSKSTFYKHFKLKKSLTPKQFADKARKTYNSTESHT